MKHLRFKKTGVIHRGDSMWVVVMVMVDDTPVYQSSAGGTQEKVDGWMKAIGSETVEQCLFDMAVQFAIDDLGGRLRSAKRASEAVEDVLDPRCFAG